MSENATRKGAKCHVNRWTCKMSGSHSVVSPNIEKTTCLFLTVLTLLRGSLLLSPYCCAPRLMTGLFHTTYNCWQLAEQTRHSVTHSEVLCSPSPDIPLTKEAVTSLWFEENYAALSRYFTRDYVQLYYVRGWRNRTKLCIMLNSGTYMKILSCCKASDNWQTESSLFHTSTGKVLFFLLSFFKVKSNAEGSDYHWRTWGNILGFYFFSLVWWFCQCSLETYAW